MTKRLFTVTEFCEAYTVSKSTFYRLMRLGQGPVVKQIGNCKRIHVDAAEAWAVNQALAATILTLV